MAYRTGVKRSQMILFPESLDEYVGPEDPVRAYDYIIGTLDLQEIGIETDEKKVGNPQYPPRTMLKLYVYGYACGIRSSRQLERATHQNLSFIWLMENLKPDHKTIAEFRRKHKLALIQALRKFAFFCLKAGLIEGNTLFVDGTKLRANAGRCRNHTQEWYQEKYQEVKKRIGEIMTEHERTDQVEEPLGSFVRMETDLSQAKKLEAIYAQAIQEFDRYESSDVKPKVPTINMTDPECALMKSTQGSHASYNIQAVVDDKNGLIANVDVVNEVNDRRQFSRQIHGAEEVLGKSCQYACADTGYSNTEDLRKVQSETTTVIVPFQKEPLRGNVQGFSKSDFPYDAEHDVYQCPQAHRLSYVYAKEKGKKLVYRITDCRLCHRCPSWGTCTNSKEGRSIVRLLHETEREQFERQYQTPELQEIYQRRKARVEHPFGHIKQNLKTTYFLIRGRLGALAEISLAALCFNIRRILTIFGGTPNFIQTMKTIWV